MPYHMSSFFEGNKNIYFKKPTRKINWKSCLDTRYRTELLALQNEMKNYYTTSSVYYSDIDYTADTWSDNTQFESQGLGSNAA